MAARPADYGSDFDDEDNAYSRCGIVIDDRSRDGNGTSRRRQRGRWCQQQGRDRHSDGKPADEHPGNWYRNGCDLHPNRTDLPGHSRPDWVDAARCNESFALRTEWRRQKLTALDEACRCDAVAPPGGLERSPRFACQSCVLKAHPVDRPALVRPYPRRTTGTARRARATCAPPGGRPWSRTSRLLPTASPL